MSKQAGRTIASVPVLIVGGGPVGLGLSLELAYRGVRCMLIEQGDGVVRLSKMGHVSVRSMEHCRRWGVAEAVRNSGFPEDYPLNQVFCTSLNGQHITTLEYPALADEPSEHLSPERKQRCPQLWFDPILARVASQKQEVTLRYNCRLIEFTQDEFGVRALVEDVRTRERDVIEARYLVGCDGSGSTVRQTLAISLLGDAVLSYSTGIYFTAPDLARYHKMGPATRYWLVGEEGTWGNLTVVDAKDIWRLTITGSKEKVEAKDFDADYWLRRCLGRADIGYSITAVLPWRRSRLVAERFMEGRILLAGDACHVNAPNGGYGMNTGLGDAVDIGWKLAAVLEGWGSDGLLESYEIERQPIAQRNVNAAANNFSLTQPQMSYAHVEENNTQGEATRAAVALAMRTNTRQEWETYGAHLGYRYENSPIVIADGTPEPEDHLSEYLPTARPGHRAPHLWLSDGRSILDLFGRAFVLLSFGRESKEESFAEFAGSAAERSIPIEVQSISDAAAAPLYERRYVLVRPDGHVAWRGDTLPRDARSFWDTVSGRALLQRKKRVSAAEMRRDATV